MVPLKKNGKRRGGMVDICSQFVYNYRCYEYKDHPRPVWIARSNCSSKERFLMPERQRKGLSGAEWKVMKIAWELQKAMAREIYTVAGQRHGWTPGTVKTLLKRLTDKGYLQTTKVGNGFVYRPARTAISALRAAASCHRAPPGIDHGRPAPDRAPPTDRWRNR